MSVDRLKRALERIWDHLDTDVKVPRWQDYLLWLIVLQEIASLLKAVF